MQQSTVLEKEAGHEPRAKTPRTAESQRFSGFVASRTRPVRKGGK